MKKQLLIPVFFAFVACCFTSCQTGPAHSQKIPHNDLSGKLDYMYFVSLDTGYMITYVGSLYDSSHCTYVYQTTNGGKYWDIIDSVPNYSFTDEAATHNNVVYGYMSEGTQSMGFWNFYLCTIDLNNHQHKVREEIIHGPGPIICDDSRVIAYVFIKDSKYFLHLDLERDNISFEKDTMTSAIKEVAFNDSLYAFLTYNNEVYMLQDSDSYMCPIAEHSSDITLCGNDCYISYYGVEESDAGILRIHSHSNGYEKLGYPAGYKTIDFLQTNSDSIIITFTKEDARAFYEDIVYSTDKGQTWKTIPIRDPIIFPKLSCYCAPFLYIKGSPNFIYRVLLE